MSDRNGLLLGIDVGNTQTHLGMFRGDELAEHFRDRDLTSTVVVLLLWIVFV